MTKEKWAQKKNFEDAMNHIRDLGDTDLNSIFD